MRGVWILEYCVSHKICHEVCYSHAMSCTPCARAKAACKPFDVNKTHIKARAETVWRSRARKTKQ